jgi:hypothetical protein
VCVFAGMEKEGGMGGWGVGVGVGGLGRSGMIGRGWARVIQLSFDCFLALSRHEVLIIQSSL